MIKFEKKTRIISYQNILMTEAVFKGFKAVNPTRKCIVNNYWSEKKHHIKNVDVKIYGGGVTWDLTK